MRALYLARWALALTPFALVTSAIGAEATAPTTADPTPIANRTVKTMLVRPDGTLVVTETPATAAPVAAPSPPPPPDTTAPPPRLKAVDDGYDAYNRGDYAAALALWLPPAKKGDGPAQNAVGDLYHEGHAVKQSDAEAARWYRKAAEQHVAEAQYSLATLYAQGHGVPHDTVLAYMWFALATAGGFDLASGDRDRTAALLTTAQMAKAAKMGAQWDPNTH